MSEPIRYVYDLPCTAAHAFATYVERIGAWWPAAYTVSPETATGVEIEPRVGGRVFARFSDQPDDVWGEVTLYEPDHRISYTTSRLQPPGSPSEITVTCEALETGCRVEFVHAGWTALNVDSRGKFHDWPAILDRFVELARGEPLTKA